MDTPNRDDAQILDTNKVFLAAATDAYSKLDEHEMRELERAVKILHSSIRGLSDNGALELLAKIGIEMSGRKIEFSKMLRKVMVERKPH